MNNLIPSMRVRVGNRGNTPSYEGVWVTEVIIKKICPVCGGPRGDKRNGRIIEDGGYYWVDNWDNPCGHVDYYHSVLVEAGHYPSKDCSQPRRVLFEVSDEVTGQEYLHAYLVPQYAWHPDVTEAEAGAFGAPEAWGLPE